MSIKEQISKSKAAIECGNTNIEKSVSIINTHWPEGAPEYLSPEGWEFEKKLAYDKLKADLKNEK